MATLGDRLGDREESSTFTRESRSPVPYQRPAGLGAEGAVQLGRPAGFCPGLVKLLLGQILHAGEVRAGEVSSL